MPVAKLLTPRKVVEKPLDIVEEKMVETHVSSPYLFIGHEYALKCEINLFGEGSASIEAIYVNLQELQEQYIYWWL